MKWTALVSVMVLAACASTEPGNPLANIPQHPTEHACSGGRWQCYALVRTDTAREEPRTGGPGLGPAELAAAYQLDTSRSTGATIAIVDAYDYPNAEHDLAAYRAAYGLPACTGANGCFQRVNQDGKPSPLPGASPPGDDWTVEAALDLDMASAACPSCKLILVEADDDQGAGLYSAQNGAASLNPSVISDSWGGAEDGSEARYEPYFDHPGIGIFVASGDSGYDDGGRGPDYPSTSAHVTGVGGTSLVAASNVRGWTEGAWSSAGSSCSGSIPKPSYQTSTACSDHMTSDVAAVADPNTGLAVYNADHGGWIVVGGTSAASPFVAGVYALYGLGGEAPGWAYANASKFFDVLVGSNGSCTTALCRAGAGWDGPTGVGTPNGAVLGAAVGGDGSSDGGGDFSLALSDNHFTLSPGSSQHITIATAVTAGGAPTLTLSATSLPEGVTASFEATTVTAGDSTTLTLSASSAAPAIISDEIRIYGKSADQSHYKVGYVTVE